MLEEAGLQPADWLITVVLLIVDDIRNHSFTQNRSGKGARKQLRGDASRLLSFAASASAALNRIAVEIGSRRAVERQSSTYAKFVISTAAWNAYADRAPVPPLNQLERLLPQWRSAMEGLSEFARHVERATMQIDPHKLPKYDMHEELRVRQLAVVYSACGKKLTLNAGGGKPSGFQRFSSAILLISDHIHKSHLGEVVLAEENFDRYFERSRIYLKERSVREKISQLAGQRPSELDRPDNARSWLLGLELVLLGV